jgi:hypothetical protein
MGFYKNKPTFVMVNKDIQMMFLMVTGENIKDRRSVNR